MRPSGLEVAPRPVPKLSRARIGELAGVWVAGATPFSVTWRVLDPALLRHAISCVEHYHLERPHQGLGNRPIEGVPKPSEGVVLRPERLGGLLSHYYRDAA